MKRTALARKTPIATRAPIRASKPKSTPMRQAAKGQPCTLRIPGVCNHDPETTVLCHLRMFGWAGAAQKPPDYLAVFACHACHDALDRRSNRAAVDPWDVVRALGETLMAQERAGTYGALK